MPNDTTEPIRNAVAKKHATEVLSALRQLVTIVGEADALTDAGLHIPLPVWMAMSNANCEAHDLIVRMEKECA
jgi:hypothetical protein